MGTVSTGACMGTVGACMGTVGAWALLVRGHYMLQTLHCKSQAVETFSDHKQRFQILRLFSD